MMETNNYQMAIDMLRCHLGLTEEEARQQLGIDQPLPERQNPSYPNSFTSENHCRATN
jgi:hypothetical protein